METIKINNKIQLIEDSTWIEVDVIVPRKNIQVMKIATQSKILKKELIELAFNHNAGEVFRVKIDVMFSNVKEFLKRGYVYGAENAKAFTELVEINRPSLGFYPSTVACFINQIKSLYVFGDCRSWAVPNNNTCYYYKNGRRISLYNNQRTDFGRKRYLKNAGEWVSNKKF